MFRHPFHAKVDFPICIRKMVLDIVPIAWQLLNGCRGRAKVPIVYGHGLSLSHFYTGGECNICRCYGYIFTSVMMFYILYVVNDEFYALSNMIVLI